MRTHARLDDEQGVSHGLCVDLATSSGLSPTEFTCTPGDSHSRRDDGLGGVCRRRDDVGTPDRFSYELTAHAFGPSSSASASAFAESRPATRISSNCRTRVERARVRPRLDSRADEGEHLRVLAREQPCRQRRARGRSGRSDVPPSMNASGEPFSGSKTAITA